MNAICQAVGPPQETSAIIVESTEPRRLTESDFLIFQARPGEGAGIESAEKCGILKEEGPLTLLQWVIASSCPNHPRFRYSPNHSRYALKSFFEKRSLGLPVLAIAKPEMVEGKSFQQQADILPEGWRSVSFVEAVATIFCYHWQNGQYPFSGWWHIWCDDVVPFIGPDSWPKWYQQGFGITTDRRMVLRIDQLYGLVYDDYSVDSVTDHNGQNILIAATSV